MSISFLQQQFSTPIRLMFVIGRQTDRPKCGRSLDTPCRCGRSQMPRKVSCPADGFDFSASQHQTGLVGLGDLCNQSGLFVRGESRHSVCLRNNVHSVYYPRQIDKSAFGMFHLFKNQNRSIPFFFFLVVGVIGTLLIAYVWLNRVEMDDASPRLSPSTLSRDRSHAASGPRRVCRRA